MHLKICLIKVLLYLCVCHNKKPSVCMQSSSHAFSLSTIKTKAKNYGSHYVNSEQFSFGQGNEQKMLMLFLACSYHHHFCAILPAWLSNWLSASMASLLLPWEAEPENGFAFGSDKWAPIIYWTFFTIELSAERAKRCLMLITFGILSPFPTIEAAGVIPNDDYQFLKEAPRSQEPKPLQNPGVLLTRHVANGF